MIFDRPMSDFTYTVNSVLSSLIEDQILQTFTIYKGSHFGMEYDKEYHYACTKEMYDKLPEGIANVMKSDLRTIIMNMIAESNNVDANNIKREDVIFFGPEETEDMVHYVPTEFVKAKTLDTLPEITCATDEIDGEYFMICYIRKQ